MPSLEEVCVKLFGHPKWVPKVLIGGALSFIPILNIFAFGYLLEYSRRLRTNRDWELPEWKELNAGLLFSNGLQLLLIILGYFAIPTLLGWAISILIKNLSFGFIGILSYLPLTICVFFGPFLVLAAIHAFLRDGLFADAWKVSLILRIAHSFTPKLIIPVICFWGVITLALPLYGIAFFLGMWILLAYSSALNFSKAN